MAKAKKASKTERTQQAGAMVTGGDLDTSMFWFGDLNVWGAFPTAPTVYQKPRSQVFYVTRNWFERSVFLKAMTLLKQDIYDWGFKLQAGAPPSSSATAAEKAAWGKKNEKVQEWYFDHKKVVGALRRDTWGEWLIQDNAVALWPQGSTPVIYPVEHLTFQDDFGIEALSFAHGLSPEKINQMASLPLETRQTLKAGKDLTLMKQEQLNGKQVTSNRMFNFEVVKRTKVGMGLAWPQIRTLFNTVGTWESLELGDWQLADALRTVYELHQIGHEIKNGPRAGLPDHFMKKVRADAVNKVIKPNQQLLATIKRLVVNFDHTITYPRPDPKFWDAGRYQAATDRLCLWAMPLAQILFAKQVNPWHGNFLKAKAHAERDLIGPFLDRILVNCMGAPKETTCVWEDDIFLDPRLMIDTLKTGLTAGPLSQETFLQKTGHNAELERSRKDTENDLPQHQTRPIWDGAHGLNPNDPAAGRPPGSGDNGKRRAKGS